MSLQQLSNTELFRHYVENGSKEAISLYFQNQTDLFYRVALKYTRNEADAEDVLQASFINIINKANQFMGIHSDEEKLLTSWCLSVVVQCALMKIRSDSSRRKRETVYSANNKFPSDDKTMVTHLENRAIYQKVEKVIFELPEKYRIPIHLKYIEGLELDVISDTLKLNGNTLRSLIKRGLEKVSAQLKEENITMTSVALIGLLKEMPIQHAPATVKTIAFKVFDDSLKSKYLIASSANSAFFSLKAICLVIGLGVIVVGSVFTYQWNLIFNINPSKSQTQIASHDEKNRSWDFIKEEDRNVDLLLGEWEWSAVKGCMIPKNNEPVVISLPIKPTAKPILVELEIGSYFPEDVDLRTTFFITGWAKNSAFLAGETFIQFDPNYLFDRYKISKIRIYIYQNHICFFSSIKSYNLIKYDSDLQGSNLVFATTYFMFRSINKIVLNEPPQEMLQVLKNHKNELGQKTELMNIDMDNFYIQKTNGKSK